MVTVHIRTAIKLWDNGELQMLPLPSSGTTHVLTSRNIAFNDRVKSLCSQKMYSLSSFRYQSCKTSNPLCRMLDQGATKSWLRQLQISASSDEDYRSSRNIAISLFRRYRNVIDRGGGDNLKEFISAGVNAYALGCTDEGLRKELINMKDSDTEIEQMQTYGGGPSVTFRILSEEGFSFRLLDHKVIEFAKERFCRRHSQPLKEEFHTRRPIQSHSFQELEMKGNIEMEGSESCSRLFLAKTYCMVDDPTTDNVLSWVPTGHSFVIPNVLHLYKDLLPRYFEHRDFFKFVLLLCHNGFKFRSSVHLQFEFAKPGFVRGKRHLLPMLCIPKPLQSKHQPLSSTEMELEEDQRGACQRGD